MTYPPRSDDELASAAWHVRKWTSAGCPSKPCPAYPSKLDLDAILLAIADVKRAMAFEAQPYLRAGYFEGECLHGLDDGTCIDCPAELRGHAVPRTGADARPPWPTAQLEPPEEHLSALNAAVARRLAEARAGLGTPPRNEWRSPWAGPIYASGHPGTGRRH